MKRSVLVLLLAFTGFSSPNNRSNHVSHGVILDVPLLVPGDDAPLFALPSAEGNSVHLNAVLTDNTAVVLKFWATWCPMCWIELLELDEEYEALRAQGIEVLAVAVDRTEDVEFFLESQSVECPVLFDEKSEAAKQYGINALPTTVLIDGAGKIVHTHIGLVPDLSEHVIALLSIQSPQLHPGQ